jgi:nitrogen fixation NifU-like protein
MAIYIWVYRVKVTKLEKKTKISDELLEEFQKHTRFSKEVLQMSVYPENRLNSDTIQLNFNGKGEITDPKCDDTVSIFLWVDRKTEVISDIKFQSKGCLAIIASSSLTTQLCKGKSVQEAYLISGDDIANTLKLPDEKVHCSHHAVNALKAAIDDYQAKNASTNEKKASILH